MLNNLINSKMNLTSFRYLEFSHSNFNVKNYLSPQLLFDNDFLQNLTILVKYW
jgi:hypothetical protein